MVIEIIAEKTGGGVAGEEKQRLGQKPISWLFFAPFLENLGCVAAAANFHNLLV